MIPYLLLRTPSPANYLLLKALNHSLGMLKAPYPWYETPAFVSPLMYFEFFFHLPTVARRNRVIPLIRKTRSCEEMEAAIQGFQNERRKLKWEVIPL